MDGHRPVARRGDPETSWAAAESVSDTTISRTQKAILRVLAKGPMTDEDIATEVGEAFTTPSGLRTRRSELVDMGMVRDSGRTKRLDSGRHSILWCLGTDEIVAVKGPQCPVLNCPHTLYGVTIRWGYAIGRCPTHKQRQVRV